MEPMNELVPVPGRVSEFHPKYSIDERQMRQYQQPKYQAWSAESSQTHLVPNVEKKGSESGSCKKYMTTKLAISILVGVIICGIPLIVISSLYAQKNKSSASTSGSSGSSSDNSGNLPSQCTSYTTNADSTRLTTNTACIGCVCDTSSYLNTGWYRFILGAGTQLATIPSSTSTCGVSYPGWFNGSFPTVLGATTTGMLCVYYSGNICYSSWSGSAVSVTYCSGYYVFYLTPLSNCNTRYCTTP